MWLATLICAAASAWTLSDAYHLDDPAIVADPLFTLRLDAGSVFLVEDDDGVPAGWVHVGEGGIDITPTRRRDARVTANRMVALLGASETQARRVGDGGAWSTGSVGAVVLGATSWDAVRDHVRPYVIDGPVVLIPTDDGHDEVLVVRRLKRDRNLAERWLAERSAWLDEVGMDPGGLLVADRWEQDAGTGAAGRWVASVKTARDWGLFAGDLVQPRVPQRWLELMVDDSGVLDPDARATVLAHGPTSVAWPVARDPFPPSDAGQPAAPWRAQLNQAAVKARFDPEGGGMAVVLAAGAQLEVEAVGGPVAHVVVDLPHHEQQAWCTEPPLPHGFELVSVGDRQGRPLEHRAVSLGRQDEDRGTVRTIAIRLPERLEAGERTVISLQTRDRLRYGHWCDYGPPIYMVGHGRATRLVPVLPRLRSHAGAPAPVEVVAGAVPMGRHNHVVVSHGAGERWEDATGRWVRVRADSRGLRLGMGRWMEERVPAGRLGAGAPDLELHSLHGDAGSGTEAMIAQVRGQLALFDPVLPPMPHRRLAITESARPSAHHAPPTIGIGNGIGSHGESQYIRTRLTHFEGMRMSFVLLGQWWVPLDVRAPDMDLPSAMALVYTLRGLEALDGTREADQAWRSVRGLIGGRAGWSARSDRTVSTPSLAWALGPALTAETRDPTALYAGMMEVLDGGHSPSWDGLQASLEGKTGRDLDGFFVTWVHSGATPALAARADRVPGGFRIEIEADLPYGDFGVPVRLGRGDAGRWIQVRVEDGRGAVEVHWDGDLPVVWVDPDRALPVRGLEGRRVMVAG